MSEIEKSETEKKTKNVPEKKYVSFSKWGGGGRGISSQES